MRVGCLDRPAIGAPKRVRGFRYVYVRVPVGLHSFTFTESLGDNIVYAAGEAGGYITARNSEGIPYALWTGTYATLYLDEPGRYREVVLRKLVEAELLPKIREAREFYKSIHGVDVLSKCVQAAKALSPLHRP